MALGAERDGQARPHAATPDDDDVHATVQHAASGLAKAAAPDRHLGRLLLLCGRGDPDTAGTASATRPPVPLPGIAAEDIPETRRYRLKNKLLGPPLVTEQLATERLRQAHRPGRAGARLHLVLGLRHRGDADPAGALRRPGRLHPGRPHHPRHPRRPLLRHPLVPGGHPALHEGRRLLRRGPRQLRAAHRADRGRGAAHRLHGHRRGADVGRHGRADQCRAQPGQHDRHGRHHRGRDPAPALRQPARHPRGRELLRHPDLLLHLLAGERHRARVRQGGARHPALHPAAARRARCTAGRSAHPATAG